MGVIIPQVITPSKASGAQVIDGSFNFDGGTNGSSSSHLTRTSSSAGNLKTWTWSGWLKRGKDTAGTSNQNPWAIRPDNNNQQWMRFESSGNTLRLYLEIGSVIKYDLTTTQTFREFGGGWYHIVYIFDSTQATESDRVQLYINGERVTSFSSATYPSQNQDGLFNTNNETYYIAQRGDGNNYFTGRLTNINFIDGQALGPEYFGFTDPLTNTWKPKKFSGNFTQLSANDGTTWSSSVSGPVNSSKPLSLLFGGTIGSGYQNGTTPTSGNTLTFDISSKNLTVTNVRLNTFISTGPGGGGTPNTFTLNGTTVPIADSDGDQTHVVAVNGQLNTIAWSYDSGNGPYVYMRGIEVDLGGGLGYELLTDGVNNTGANSFYLPFDGNSPIGEDKSGNGNDFTPVNFGGSVELDSPLVTGARPLLNTTQGGTQAGVGYFGSSENKVITVTVASKTGGGNAYFFDGVERDSLALIRGTTIRFDTTDSSNDSHPFKLSSTNADSSGGTEYTDGVAYFVNGGSKNGTDYVNQYSSHSSGFRGIKWTVPHNASTTYYYCTVHTGMGEDGRLTSTTDETKADKFAWKCFFAFPGVGPTLDLSSVINQKSGGKALTVTNAVASRAQSHFYNGSFYFDGSGDYINAESSSDFAFGTGDFTIEGWVYPETNNANKTIFSTNWGANGSLIITYSHPQSPSGTGKFAIFDHTQNNGQPTVATSNAYDLDNWYHVAFVRNGTSHKFYINGIEDGSATYTASDLTRTAFILGAVYTNGTETFDGYIQDVRVYKGVAKYTSNFVVPSTSPDVLPDTPSGVAGSSDLTKITDGAVHFDGNGDYLEATSSTDFAFGTGDFTLEAYIYATSLPNTNNRIFCSGAGGSGDRTNFQLMVGSAGYLEFAHSTNYQTSNGLIGTNKWHHVAATREGTSLRMFIDGRLFHTGTSSVNVTENGGVTIGREFGYSSYFNGFISNARILKGTALYTDDFTVPARTLTNVTNTKLLCCQSNVTSGAAAVSPNISGINDGTVWSSTVTGPTRKEDRVANAFNGSTSGPGAIPAYPGTLTFAPGFTGLTTVKIYGYYAGSGVTLHVNGSQQSPSSGAFTLTISTSTLDSVVWTATNGFNYMRIDAIEIDSTVLIDPVVGPDDSNEAATNFNPFNTDINTVRGQETGYATLNPLNHIGNGTLSNGNLEVTGGSGTWHGFSTIGVSSGKWYAEIDCLSGGSASNIEIGIVDLVQLGTNTSQVFDAFSRGFGYRNDANKITNNSATSYGATYDGATYGDTIGMAVDLDNGTLAFYKNGVSQGTAFTGIPSGYTYHLATFVRTSSDKVAYNFGQKPFKFSPPDGFQPLNTANTRPVNVISRPDQYVGIVTYLGNGTTGQSITGLNFDSVPDLVYIKERDATGSPLMFDTVRGAPLALQTRATTAEYNIAETLTSFDKNGFSVDYDGSSTSIVVNRTNNYVAWCWKAGGKDGSNAFNVDGKGYASAAAAGMSDGTMTVTGSSVGTKQGFSILTYTGTNSNESIPHGLDSAPSFYIVKARENSSYTDFWSVYHQSLGKDAYIKLNSTDAASTSSNIWNNTAPTDSLFYVRSDSIANENNIDYVAYLWHDVPGLQKFGSYESNNSTDGPYVELGFRPALLWVKEHGASGQSWHIIDKERDVINPVYRYLYTNGGDAEGGSASATGVDFLSNGFKIRNNDNAYNASSSSFIYMAWAEAPSVDLFGGGANAR